MTDLGYVVERYDNKLCLTVHMWNPGQELSSAIWTAPVEPSRWDQTKKAVIDSPSAFLVADSHLYMGLESGHVEKIDLKTRESVADYGPRQTFARGSTVPDVNAKIRGLAFRDGVVYDASAGGLFETESGKEIDDRVIGSVEVYKGRLLIVPHGANPKKLRGWDYDSPRTLNSDVGQFQCFAPEIYRFQDSVRESKAGSLIDAFTKEVVMERVEPFDGSGMSPGKHRISKGKVYMHHGNWLAEMITIRKFPTGEIQQRTRIASSKGFIEHKGTLYDLRLCYAPPNDFVERIFKSQKAEYSFFKGVLFDVPKGEKVTGMASAGDQGVLIALYNEKSAISRIVSHLHPNEPLLEYEGVMRLHKI